MNGPELLIPIVLFLSVTLVLLLFRKFTNDERLALIEKGGSADMFAKKSKSYPALRYGLLLFGGGLGILAGNMLAETQMIQEQAAIFSFILIGGGLGLFASYFMERKAAERDKMEKNQD